MPDSAGRFERNCTLPVEPVTLFGGQVVSDFPAFMLFHPICSLAILFTKRYNRSMKQSSNIVNKIEIKRTGRPRTVSDDAEEYAPPVGVRLPHALLTEVDVWATEKGLRRSDAIRDMIAYAAAGRRFDKERASRRRKK